MAQYARQALEKGERVNMRNIYFVTTVSLSIVLALGSIGCASAQSFSSFGAATIKGVSITGPSNDYNVSLSANATVNGQHITNIFGVFELFNTAVTSPITGTPPIGYTEVDDIHGVATTGQMFGYTNNSKSNAILSGSSLSGFGFIQPPAPNDFGFHFSYGSQVVTGYFKAPVSNFNASTPEASSMAGFMSLLGMGGLLAFRKRKTVIA